jgi:hypothetical protein
MQGSNYCGTLPSLWKLGDPTVDLGLYLIGQNGLFGT